MLSRERENIATCGEEKSNEFDAITSLI